MKSRCFSFLLGAMLLAGMVTLGGCANKISKEKLWKDPSPGMGTLAHTDDQFRNSEARVVDTNLRQIAYDWQSFWLYRTPSHLSDYPIP